MWAYVREIDFVLYKCEVCTSFENPSEFLALKRHLLSQRAPSIKQSSRLLSDKWGVMCAGFSEAEG